MNRLSAVVPIKVGGGRKSDSGTQMEILFRSLERYCGEELFKTILIVCPTRDVNFLREKVRRWQKLPLQVLDENTLFSGRSIRKSTPGWAKQQLIKMVACKFIETDFYMTLDADCFCIRPSKYSDFVRDGKGLIQVEPKEVHKGWWKQSAKILGHRPDMDKPGMSVTPAVLSTTAMSALLDALNDRYGQWEVYLQTYYQPHHINTLKQCLFSSVWTEYTLYYTFLEMKDKVPDFHFGSASKQVGGEPLELISANSCWEIEDFKNWDPASVFGGHDAAAFAVIQSRLRLNSDEVLKKLERYI